jgi:hypothetical protein
MLNHSHDFLWRWLGAERKGSLLALARAFGACIGAERAQPPSMVSMNRNMGRMKALEATHR